MELKISTVFFLFMFYGLGRARVETPFNMDFFCGKTVIVDPAYSVRGSFYKYMGPAKSCRVVFNSYSQKESDVVAVINILNIDCRMGHLDIYDKASKLTGRNGLCGTKPKNKIYQSKYHSLTLDLVTKGTMFKGNFDITLSSVTKGINCTKNEFMCANTNCIYKGLLCDGCNNCGDATDEVNCRSSSVNTSSSFTTYFLLITYVLLFAK